MSWVLKCGHYTSTDTCNVTVVIREFDGNVRSRRRSATVICYNHSENALNTSSRGSLCHKILKCCCWFIIERDSIELQSFKAK